VSIPLHLQRCDASNAAGEQVTSASLGLGRMDDGSLARGHGSSAIDTSTTIFSDNNRFTCLAMDTSGDEVLGGEAPYCLNGQVFTPKLKHSKVRSRQVAQPVRDGTKEIHVVDPKLHTISMLCAEGEQDVADCVVKNLLCAQLDVRPVDIVQRSMHECQDKAIEVNMVTADQERTRIYRAKHPLSTVWGTINNRPVRMMIDTGAQVSVMSVSLFKAVGGELSTGPRSLRVANNTKISSVGECTIDLALGRRVFAVDVLVLQDTSYPFILGQDVMLPTRTQIHLQERTLLVDGEELSFARDTWCVSHRVHLVEDTILQHGLNVVTVQLPLAVEGDHLIWPADALTLHGLFADASLVTTNKQGRSKWLIINTNDSPVSWAAGYPVAHWDPDDDQCNVSSCDLFSIDEITEQDNWLNAFNLDKLDISESQRARLIEVLVANQEAISKNPDDLGLCREAECTIDTGDAQPVKLRWRRLAPLKQAAVDAEIKNLLRLGLIRESKSPWAAPVVVVNKKCSNGGKRFRVCTDYRELNKHTIKDAFPLPDVTRVLEELNGNSWFSTLDLTSGYLQVPVAAKDQAKTAFTTQDGLYEYVVLPFGLTNAPAQFSRMMARIFADSHHCATIYMDDIVVRARDFDQALQHLDHVLKKLINAGLKIRPDKCHLVQREVQFLGHVVSSEGIKPDQDKTRAVLNWPQPTCRRELSAFIGLCGYYRRFIGNFSTIARPLHDLLSVKSDWSWSTKCKAAFKQLKELLTTAPILGYPDFGPGAGEFLLDVDASDVAAGAVLSQIQDGRERVLAYGHKTFTKSQRNYCTTMRELCALAHFVFKYRKMVWGCHTIVRTDHQALIWLKKYHATESMLEHWYSVLEEALELDFDAHSALETIKWSVQHRAGRAHANADALSRVKKKQKPSHAECPSCAPTFGNADTLPANSPVCTVELESQFQRLQQWQREEDGWQDICTRILQQEPPPAPREFAGHSEETQWLVAQWNRLVVVDNLLCRRNRSNKPKVVVPEAHKITILRLFHNLPGSLHEGGTKMISRIAEKFYWRNLHRDVQLYIFDCDDCKRFKTHRRVKEALQPFQAAFPNQRVHVDFLGPLTVSANGHSFIFVAVDAFSGYVSAWPAKDTSAVTALNCLLDWFALFGLCGWIHSDRGAAFEADLTALICTQFGIAHSMSSAQHPQGNGRGELAVKEVKKTLKLHVQAFGTRWDVALKFALLTLRSGVHSRTGVSPATLFLGREIKTMGDMVSGVSVRQLDSSTHSFARHVLSDLDVVNKQVRAKLATSQQRNKEYFDTRLYSQPIKIGSRVLRWDNATLVKRAGYSGPYVVINADNKRAQIEREDDKTYVAWVSRDRLQLLGNNKRWQNNVDSGLWANQASRININGQDFIQHVGGGVNRVPSGAGRPPRDATEPKRETIHRAAKQKAQCKLQLQVTSE